MSKIIYVDLYLPLVAQKAHFNLITATAGNTSWSFCCCNLLFIQTISKHSHFPNYYYFIQLQRTLLTAEKLLSIL